MVIIYSLLSAIDYIIYSLAASMFRIIIDIANVSFFQADQIRDISNRVYIVVGVLMLFKLVISAVQYMINPDAFDDKDKGIGGILKKTAISLGLIVLVPSIFNFLLTMQKPIIESIPNVVFGTEKTVDVTDDKMGAKLSFQVLSSFVQVREGHESKISSDDKISDIPSFRDHVLAGCPSVSVFGLFGSYDDCHYNYIIIVSTVCGVFLCYILFAMILDIAIRTIKFGIIQILAPIPISSYVFSKDKLSKFAKTAMTVYLDLFIRMLVIYFILFAIQNVIDSGIIKELSDGGDLWRSLLVNVAIIFGLLMFAKNAPKFITDLLGLQDVSSNDMKDMFTRAGGLFGTTVAGFRTARSNYTAQKERAIGKGVQSKAAQRLRGALGAAGGFGSATGRGLWMSSQGKGYKDVRQNAFKSAINARDRRIDRVDNLYNTEGLDKYINVPVLDEYGHEKIDSNGNKVMQKVKNPEYYGYMDYRRDVKREKLGIPSSEAFIKARYDAMEKIAKTASDAKGHGVGKMNETPNRYQISFRDKDGKFASTDFAAINYSLGYESLSMEQVRNLYAMAKNGQEFQIIQRNADGSIQRDRSGKAIYVTGKLKQSDIDSLGTLVQTIEKRTSYMKEAELMATGDPAASPNVDKLVIGLKTNRDMFNAPVIMKPIIEKMQKNLKNYRINPADSNDQRVDIEGKIYDVATLKYDDVLNLVKLLQVDIKEKEPKASDDKYADMKKQGKSDAEIAKEFASDKKKYFDIVSMRADILTGVKDSFEEVAKTQYKAAQIADNKAQKAQKAVSNNEKKG